MGDAVSTGSHGVGEVLLLVGSSFMVCARYVHSRAPTEEGQEAVDDNLSLRFIPHDT